MIRVVALAGLIVLSIWSPVAGLRVGGVAWRRRNAKRVA